MARIEVGKYEGLLNGIKLYIDGLECSVGDEVDITSADEIKLVAPDNITIEKPEYSTLYTVNIEMIVNNFSLASKSFYDRDISYFSEDKKIFTFYITSDTKFDGLNDNKVHADKLKLSVDFKVHEPEPEPEPVDVTGDILTNFIMSKEGINNVLNTLWMSEEFSFSNYVHKMFEYPFKIDDSYISDDTVDIKVGKFDTGSSEYVLTKDEMIVDLGVIRVDSKYNNAFDYKDTTCLLYAPYMKTPLEIDNTYVIDKEISLYYVIDLYNGYATLNVVSELLDSPIHQIEVNLTRDIPFYNRHDREQGLTLEHYVYDELDHCYIEVVRNKPVIDNLFGKDTIIIDNLKNRKGYIEVSKILLESNAFNTEKREIESLLSQGIFIND